MASYTSDPADSGARRQLVAVGFFLLVALALNFLAPAQQQLVASGLRATVLRPFVMTQDALAEARLKATESTILQARLDSLVAATTARTNLREENRRLRGLLSLRARIPLAYRAASLIRPGTSGSESMFLLDEGSASGVRVQAPVITREGLVGMVREVRDGTSIGMDWTHPDFRASAMTLDGTTYGIVESVRGDFREEDRLMLNGTAFHTDLAPGTVVVTSGLGGVLPRGIPVGRVESLAEADAGWRKSYWLEPFVEPGSVTHVLVALDGGVAPSGPGPVTGSDSAAAGDSIPGPVAGDLSYLWPEDSIGTAEELRGRAAHRADSLALLRDSVERLRARLERLERSATDTAGEGAEGGGG